MYIHIYILDDVDSENENDKIEEQSNTQILDTLF